MSGGRFSFRRGPDYSGLRRLPATYELRHSGKQLATIQQDKRSDLWFWYGDKQNTSHRQDTLENVKAEALAHFKAKFQR